MTKALTWMSQSLEGTTSPDAPRIAMVAKPTAAEARRANHRPRLRPLQGVRASWRSRSLSSGSSFDPTVIQALGEC